MEGHAWPRTSKRADDAGRKKRERNVKPWNGKDPRHCSTSTPRNRNEQNALNIHSYAHAPHTSHPPCTKPASAFAQQHADGVRNALSDILAAFFVAKKLLGHFMRISNGQATIPHFLTVKEPGCPRSTQRMSGSKQNRS